MWVRPRRIHRQHLIERSVNRQVARLDALHHSNELLAGEIELAGLQRRPSCAAAAVVVVVVHDSGETCGKTMSDVQEVSAGVSDKMAHLLV